MLREAGASWGWALAIALVTLLPGILILVWPGETLRILAFIIGLYLLVAGVFRFVTAFAHHEGHDGSRFSGVLVSVLFVLAGVLVLRNPVPTVAALSLIVGIVWLVSGMLSVYTAVANRALPHRGLAAAVGVLGIVAGVVVLAYPVESAVALARLLGLWLVLLGLVELAMAFALRAALRRQT
jgi:uncharacterized membrane protein HdeD (DUF308 family)